MVFFDVTSPWITDVRRVEFWKYCWPGVGPLWQHGHPMGLIAAVAFSVLLNLAILATLVWPQILSPQISLGLWPAAALLWLGSALQQFRTRQRMADGSLPGPNSDDTLFIQAQAEYLKGNWEEAEWLLRQRLATRHRDIESRLLLVTLYRRRGRLGLASDQLQILKRFDGSVKWADEMSRESQLLKSALDSEGGPTGSTSETSPDSESNSTGESELRTIDTIASRPAA